MLVSHSFERAHDRDMAIDLARDLGWEWKDSKLSFEGGNIVSDERYVFVGANTVAYNAVSLGWTEPDVVRQLQRELGREVLVIGPVPQPVGHIDMMLTPLGRHRVLLADPGWGARIAEKQLAEAPESVEAFERDRKRVV